MKLPSEGRAWLELRSAHFVLDTDLADAAARQLVLHLEQRRQALIDTAWHGATFPPFTTRIVALRDTDELEEFAVWGVGGYLQRDLFGEKQIVFSAERGRGYSESFSGLQIATHELVHDLASRYFARQPRWLGEGLARFLETMELDEKGGRAVIGKPRDVDYAPVVIPDYRGLIPYSAPWYESIGTLFDPDALVDEDLAGQLVFYLINMQPKGYKCLQDALYRGDASELAWNSCLPAYAGPEGKQALAQALIAWFGAHDVKYRILTVPTAASAGDVELRTLSDDEARVLRAGLLVLSLHSRDTVAANRLRAKADTDAVLARNPAFAPALAMRVNLLEQRSEKIAVARAAAAANPDDWQALALLDLAMGEEATPAEEAERRSALEKAASLSPRSAWVLQRLARSRVRSKETAGAADLARKSLDLDPDNTESLDTGAMVADALGDCAGALQLARMAVERLPQKPVDEETRKQATVGEAQWREQMRAMRARLADYELRCGKPAPASR